MAMMSILDAVRVALREEMHRDPLVWVLGEDLHRGGIYGQYAGLLDEFGPQRVVSTPISEATIAGAGLGAALSGTRPVVEMRISDFALCAMDELVNQIAKARYMFGGQARTPLVVRMPHGIMRNSAAQHSQSLEAWYVHVPGLVVVAPATAADAKGLLTAAIRSDDPVIFFEPRAIWGQVDEVPDASDATPFGRARIARSGNDITIVAWSSAVSVAGAAATLLEASGVSTEVLDLRTLWPWDRDAVLASVAKTGRLLVVQEGVVVGGFGGEIVASVVETSVPGALTCIRRVGAPRAPVPYSPVLEGVIHITPERVRQAALEMLGRS